MGRAASVGKGCRQPAQLHYRAIDYSYLRLSGNDNSVARSESTTVAKVPCIVELTLMPHLHDSLIASD